MAYQGEETATADPGDYADQVGGTSNRAMFLTFRMCAERFALPVESVNEILDEMPETPVPNSVPWASSLINVRGNVVPIIDIHHRLGLVQSDKTDLNRLVVLDVKVWSELTRLAVRVDSVEEVIEADSDRFEVVPELGARWPAEFINGVAHHNDDLVVLLNCENLFRIDRRTGPFGPS
ncbi:MAG: chemotaxis protein CheW [Pseudomonadota bacterium]